LHLNGERKLARANAEFEIDAFQLLLRRLFLSMNVVESRAQLRDLVSNAIEISVACRLRIRARENEEE